MTVPRAPVRKITAVGLGGAVATMVLWVLDVSDVHVPALVAGAITTVVTFFAGYLVPSVPLDGEDSTGTDEQAPPDTDPPGPPPATAALP